MKNLTITFNFIIPDTSELNEARDLADYIIDCISDMWHDLDYRLSDYKISSTETEIVSNNLGEPNCKSLSFYKYYKKEEDNAGK